MMFLDFEVLPMAMDCKLAIFIFANVAFIVSTIQHKPITHKGHQNKI